MHILMEKQKKIAHRGNLYPKQEEREEKRRISYVDISNKTLIDKLKTKENTRIKRRKIDKIH